MMKSDIEYVPHFPKTHLESAYTALSVKVTLLHVRI